MPFCTNCGNQNPDTAKFCTTCGSALVQSTNKFEKSVTPQSQQVSVQPSELQKNFDEVIETIKRLATEHKKIIIGVLGLIVVFIVVYNLFLKANPTADAKKIASSYCDCSTKYTDALNKVNEDFIKSFSSNNFKKRQEARNKLQELQNPINISNNECNNMAQANYTELRNKYITNGEQLEKFDFAFSSQQGACNPGNQSKLSILYSEIEGKIKTIKEQGPGLEKIKGDLIGKEIPGSRFTYLSEFEKCTIIDSIETPDRLEYRVRLNMIWLPQNLHTETEVMIIYLANENGWYFSSVSMPDMFYKNIIPANLWIKISLLNNCTMHWDDNQKLVWKTSETGQEMNTGPDETDIVLPYSNIYWVKSREGHDITVKFKYTPIN